MGSNALRFGFALTFSLLLSACQAGSNMPDDPAVLVGAWQLEAVGGEPVVAQTQPSLVFDANQLNGNASCNRFFGAYQYTDGLLTISGLASTKMMCSPSVMAQENDVLGFLGQASQVRVDKDRLHLLNDRGEVLISAQRAEADE